MLTVSSTGCNNKQQSFAKLSYSAIDNVLTNLLPAGLQDFFQVFNVPAGLQDFFQVFNVSAGLQDFFQVLNVSAGLQDFFRCSTSRMQQRQ